MTQRPVEVTEVIVRDEKPKVPESLAVIYNRIPKTGSTAFTHVVYKLVEQNNMFVVHIDSKSHVRLVHRKLLNRNSGPEVANNNRKCSRIKISSPKKTKNLWGNETLVPVLGRKVYFSEMRQY